MRELVESLTAQAGGLVAAAGLISATAVLLRTRSPVAALPVLLDFLLAAGLLRLAAAPTSAALATAAVILVIRRVLTRQLKGAHGTRFATHRTRADVQVGTTSQLDDPHGPVSPRPTGTAR